MLKGRIHSIETFGTLDGPGIRFIIFFQGCQNRCAYCHNPDTWGLKGGDEMTVGELLDKAEHYRSYWGNSGGITVSGGEALVQMDFLLELFREAHRRGINTCLDTSATLFRPDNKAWMDKFDALLDFTDTVLLDIKHIDDNMHRRLIGVPATTHHVGVGYLTGHSNKSVLACARYLSERGVPVWIRHVLVPGWTDKDEWLHALRAFIDTLTNVERVEVLPYHTMGVYKYEKLGIPYPLEGVPAPTQERIDNARRILAG